MTGPLTFRPVTDKTVGDFEALSAPGADQKGAGVWPGAPPAQDSKGLLPQPQAAMLSRIFRAYRWARRP